MRKTFTIGDVKKEVEKAEKKIRVHIRKTYLEHSHYFSKIGNANIFLKLENTQITGSFKLRGALNSILSLSDEEKGKGIITASTGNHGAAVSYAMKKLGLKGKIYVPENISAAKLEVLQAYNTDLFFYGTDNAITETFARKTAESEGSFFISPYNDPKVIGGQGTIGIEIIDQLNNIDAVFVPVGGGGLIAGIAGYLKSVLPEIKIIGCQPENSHVMFDSVKAGKILEIDCPPSISDGTAGGIEEGSITFDICRDCIDEFVLVSEEEIENALKLVLQKSHMMVEGAAALSIASFLKVKEKYKGKNVVLILSGNKLGFETLRKIVSGGK